MSTALIPMDRKYQIVMVVLVSGLLIWGVSAWIVNERLEDLKSEITLNISQQQTLLTSIAETTAANGADLVTESIIKDCTPAERTEFDTLLGRLSDGLSFTELTKLERLFGRCANFYAQRKSVMVSRLVRELEVYQGHIAQLEAISKGDHNEEYKVGQWQKLVEEEKKMSELFNTQVAQQDKIIQALVDGKRVDSEEIKAILHEAGETQGMLILTTRQSADIRTQLKSI